MTGPHEVHRAALRARELGRRQRQGSCTPPPDPFERPAESPTGVVWAPTDYRPVDQALYREYAARRDLPS